MLRARRKKTNIFVWKTCLPEEAKNPKNGKEDFPEEHDLPQIVEMEQLADSGQGLKEKNTKNSNSNPTEIYFYFHFLSYQFASGLHLMAQ